MRRFRECPGPANNLRGTYDGMTGRVIIRGALVAMTLATVGVAADLPPILIDPCDDAASWSAHPADGVTMALVPAPGEQGQALGLEFAFSGGGWAIARREVDLTLPEDYVIRFRLRGDGPPNTLEMKLIDRSGENVWWRVWRDVAWPDQWTTFQARKRQISFAWGPLGGGDPTHVAAIELAVTAGQGGAGTVWIDQLELVPREPVHGPPPEPLATATSAADGQAAAKALVRRGSGRRFHLPPNGLRRCIRGSKRHPRQRSGPRFAPRRRPRVGVACCRRRPARVAHPGPGPVARVRRPDRGLGHRARRPGLPPGSRRGAGSLDHPADGGRQQRRASA